MLLGKDMRIVGQVTALYFANKYFAKKWAHYDIVEDGEGMTAADRFKEEF